MSDISSIRSDKRKEKEGDSVEEPIGINCPKCNRFWFVDDIYDVCACGEKLS